MDSNDTDRNIDKDKILIHDFFGGVFFSKIQRKRVSVVSVPNLPLELF